VHKQMGADMDDKATEQPWREDVTETDNNARILRQLRNGDRSERRYLSHRESVMDRPLGDLESVFV